MLPGWIKISTSIFLLLLILKAAFNTHTKQTIGKGISLTVNDMSCEKCVRTLNKAIGGVKGVDNVRIDLKKSKIEVDGQVKKEDVMRTIKKAGYTVENKK